MRRILLPLLALNVILSVGVALLKNVGESHAQEAAAETPIYVMPKSGPFGPEEVAVSQSDCLAAWARFGHSNASSITEITCFPLRKKIRIFGKLPLTKLGTRSAHRAATMSWLSIQL